MVAADLLGEARMKADREKNKGRKKGTPKTILKIDSRKLRSGDWIVMAEDDYTRDWLAEYFNTAEFSDKFRATPVSERGDDFKYAIKIQPPDSKKSNDELLEYILEDVEELGYLRINNESRFYKDRDNSGTTNKAYYKSLKKGTPFDDKGVPYVKTLWLRMNAQAHEIFQSDPTELNVYFGSGKIEIEQVKEKNKKRTSNNPSAERNTQGGADTSRNGASNNNREGETGHTDGRDYGNNLGNDDQEMDDVFDEDLVSAIEASEGDGTEGPGAAADTRKE